jgi:hypothetical protein
MNKSAKVVLGRRLISSEPQPHRGELDHGEEVGGELVVAGCDAAEVFAILHPSAGTGTYPGRIGLTLHCGCLRALGAFFGRHGAMNPARGIGLRNIGERREPAKVISPMDALRRSVETERKPVEGHPRRRKRAQSKRAARKAG